jgi:hypothetical protein
VASIRIALLSFWGRAIVSAALSLLAVTAFIALTLAQGYSFFQSPKVIAVAAVAALLVGAWRGVQIGQSSRAKAYRTAVSQLTASAISKAITAMWRGPIPEDPIINAATTDLSRLYVRTHRWRAAKTTLIAAALGAVFFGFLAAWPRQEHGLELGDPLWEAVIAALFAAFIATSWYTVRRVSRRLAELSIHPDKRTPPRGVKNEGNRMSKPSKSSAEQLFDEACRLAAEFNSEEVLAAALEGVELLREGLDGVNPRTREIFIKPLERMGELSNQMRDFVGRANEIIHSHEGDNYAERIHEMLANLHRVDAEKLLMTLGGFEQLADCTPEQLSETKRQMAEAQRRVDNVYLVNDAISLTVASAQIPMYSLAYAFADVANAFLGRPTKYRATLNVAGSLVQAVAMDFAGLAFPFVGTLKTVFEQMEPWIERETEKIRQAAHQLDRVFNYGDQLDTLSMQYVPFVDTSIGAATKFYDSYSAAFTIDISWLNEIYVAAAGD